VGGGQVVEQQRAGGEERHRRQAVQALQPREAGMGRHLGQAAAPPAAQLAPEARAGALLAGPVLVMVMVLSGEEAFKCSLTW
jgi:hypothetical protein